jgi:hypothetical protein
VYLAPIVLLGKGFVIIVSAAIYARIEELLDMMFYMRPASYTLTVCNENVYGAQEAQMSSPGRCVTAGTLTRIEVQEI